MQHTFTSEIAYYLHVKQKNSMHGKETKNKVYKKKNESNLHEERVLSFRTATK